MKKKIIALITATVLTASLFMLAACGGGQTPPPADDNGNGATEQQTAGEDKVWIIATDTTFAPFEFQDEAGNFVGIDMEILAAVAADQGFKYEVNALGFDAALQAVLSGQAHGVIAGMSITDERKEIFDFSAPYFDSGVVMGVAATNDEIKGYEDLEGKKVAVKIGTVGEEFAESIKDQYGFTTVQFKDSAMMYADVEAGNSDALFEDYPVLGYAISQGVGLQIVTDLEMGNSYGFAVAKGENQELLQMFDAGLANIKASGKYQEILDTYIKR